MNWGQFGEQPIGYTSTFKFLRNQYQNSCMGAAQPQPPAQQPAYNEIVSPPQPSYPMSCDNMYGCVESTPLTLADHVQLNTQQQQNDNDYAYLNEIRNDIYDTNGYQPVAAEPTQQMETTMNYATVGTTQPLATQYVNGIHQTTAPTAPKKKKKQYNTKKAGRQRTKKKTYQQVMLFLMLCLLGIDVQVSRGSSKAVITQNLYVDEMRDNDDGRVLFQNNKQFEAFCKVLDPQMSMKDKKGIIIATEMQLIVFALEEMGFEFDIKTTDKSRAKFIHNIQYPILNSLKSSDVARSVPVVNCSNPIIGKNVYKVLMKDNMMNNSYTYERDVVNAVKTKFMGNTQEFIENIHRFASLNQEHITDIIKNHLAQRIWNF